MCEEERYALPSYLLALMDRFTCAGEEVYLVGGSLRDLMRKQTPNDYDLATSASPEKTISLFPDCRVIETGIRHGTVTVLFEGNPIEITTFRQDGDYVDARHPQSVTFTRKIREDLARRDFTVNAMAYHPDLGVVDPFGGREDLAKGILRGVGDPHRRIAEDALRIMRAYRFSAQLNFVIEKETAAACGESAHKLSGIARERIAAELLRLLSSRGAGRALGQMKEQGVLSYVTGTYAPDEVIMERIGQMPKDTVARLGFYFAGTDEEKAKKLVRELKLSNQIQVGVGAVVRGSNLSLREPADARRLIATCGQYAYFAACASVLLGWSCEEAPDWVRASRAPSTVGDLAVNGGDLLAIGFRGREIGEVLKALLEAVLEDPEKNTKEILLSMARGIKSEDRS